MHPATNTNAKRKGKQPAAEPAPEPVQQPDELTDDADHPVDLEALYELLAENNSLLRIGFAQKIAAAERAERLAELADMGAPVPQNIFAFFKGCALEQYDAALNVPLAFTQRARAELAAQTTAAPESSEAKRLRLAWQQVGTADRPAWKVAFLALQQQMLDDNADTQ